LLNAVALNNAAMNIMRVAGAGLAGLLLIVLDFGEVYLLNALIYLGVIWTTLRMTVPDDDTASKAQVSLLSDLLDGFRYLRSNRSVLSLVGMAVVLFALGQPYQQVFVPLIAVEVLAIGRSGVGLMLAVTGVGALVGSLFVAAKSTIAKRSLVMLGALAVFSVALIVLAESRWAALSIGALFVAGSMTVTYMALNSSLLLETAPPEYHGRVMSLMSLDRGVMPIGAILGGALAHSFGTQTGLALMGALCLLLTGLLLLFVPALRTME
jgi:predicted MFS family arabinose efflux permease